MSHSTKEEIFRGEEHVKFKIIKSTRMRREDPPIIDLEEVMPDHKEMLKCSECYKEYRELFSHMDHPAPICRKCLKELGL